MRIIAIISLIILVTGCGNTKKTAKDGNNIKPSQLNGTWVPVQQEFGGTALPGASFKNQKLVISDSTYTVSAESVDKGVVKYAGDKIDIYGKEGINAGKHYTAIYKFENGELTICYNLAGDRYPETYETKGKPMYFLSVFKKNE